MKCRRRAIKAKVKALRKMSVLELFGSDGKISCSPKSGSTWPPRVVRERDKSESRRGAESIAMRGTKRPKVCFVSPISNYE